MSAYRIPSTLSPYRRALARSTLDNWRRLWEPCRHKIGHRLNPSCHQQLHQQHNRLIWEARSVLAPTNLPRTANRLAPPSLVCKATWTWRSGASTTTSTQRESSGYWNLLSPDRQAQARHRHPTFRLARQTRRVRPRHRLLVRHPPCRLDLMTPCPRR